MPYSAEVKPGRYSEKAEEIDRILSTPDVDLWRLRELALSEGGLVNDHLRRRAWPKLLGVVDLRDNSEDGISSSSQQQQNNLDESFNNSHNSRGCTLPVVPASPAQSEQSSEFGGDQDNTAANASPAAMTATPTITTSPKKGGVSKLRNFFEKQQKKNHHHPSSSSSSLSTPPAPPDDNNNILTSDAGSGWMQVHNNSQQQHPDHDDDHHDDEAAGEDYSTASTAAFSTASTTAFESSDLCASPPTKGNRSSFHRRRSGEQRRSLGVAAKSLDARQIELDVHRCTWHLLTGNQRTQRLQMEHKRNRRVAKLIRRKQRRLANLLNLTLLQSYQEADSPQDRLRYYQGYHDVACIFLSALGGAAQAHPLVVEAEAADKKNNTNSNTSTTSPYAGLSVPALGCSASPEALAAQLGIDLPAKLLVRVSQSHLRDYLKSNFVELQTAIRLTVFPLLALLDPPVHEHLYQAQMEPFFALSWLITWFSHEIRDTELAKRLFDVFIVSHPLLPIYLAIAMVIHPINRQEVLEAECDFAVLHQVLRGLPRNSSMVGWKYRPGDGYVSDDEEDDDDDDDDDLLPNTSGVDGDFAIIREELLKNQDTTAVAEEEPAGAQSSVSTAGGSAAESTARVPFQELIDLALLIVKKMPPRKLLNLSKRYYGAELVQEYLSQAPRMSLFDDLPTWSVAPYADADFVLLQRVMNGESLSSNAPAGASDDAVEISRIIKEKQYSPAVVALGLGIAGTEAARRKRRRRRMIVVAITIAVVAVAIGIAVRQQRQQQQQQQQLGPPSSTGKTSSAELLSRSSTASSTTNTTRKTQPLVNQRMTTPTSSDAIKKVQQSSPSQTKTKPVESTSPTVLASSPTTTRPSVQTTARQAMKKKVDNAKSGTTTATVTTPSSPATPTTLPMTMRSGRSGRSGSMSTGGMAATRMQEMNRSWWRSGGMMTETAADESTSTSNIDSSKPGQETKVLPIASIDKNKDIKVKGSRHGASDASRLPMATTPMASMKNTASSTMEKTSSRVPYRSVQVSMGYGGSHSKIEAHSSTSRWTTPGQWSGRFGALSQSLRGVGLFGFSYYVPSVATVEVKAINESNKPPTPPHCGSELTLEKPATIGFCFLELNRQLRNEWIHAHKLSVAGFSRLVTEVNRRFIQAWNHTKEISIQQVGQALEGTPGKVSVALEKALSHVFPSSPLVVRNITDAVKDFKVEQLVRSIIHFLQRAAGLLNRHLSDGLKLVVKWLHEPFKF